MRKCWIDGEEYWLHDGKWAPRSHFYDYGEEPIYLGPPHRRRRGRRIELAGLLVAGPIYAYVIAKLLGY